LSVKFTQFDIISLGVNYLLFECLLASPVTLSVVVCHHGNHDVTVSCNEINK